MDDEGSARKDALRHGDVTAIARQTGLSVQHVSECVKGRRVPSARLRRAIDRLTAKRLAEQLATETAA